MDYKKNLIRYRILILSLIFLITGLFLDRGITLFQKNKIEEKADFKQVEKVLKKKETQLNEAIGLTSLKLEKREFREFTSSRKKSRRLESLFSDPYFSNLENNGLAILVFQRDTLKFWSNNTLPINKIFSETNLHKQMAYLHNGYYVIKRKTFENKTIVGLILIKTHYSYQNKFLKNNFQKDFKLSESVQLSLHSDFDGYKIHNHEGEYLFSLIATVASISEKPYYFISIFFYALCGIFFFIFLIYRLRREKKLLTIIFMGVMILLIRFLMIEFKFPPNLYTAEFFAPQYFGESFWFSSLGDFLLNSFCVFIFIYYLYFRIDVNSIISIFSNRNNKTFFLFAFISLLFLEVSFLVIHSLFESLIVNSSIPFELHKVLKFNTLTFISFLILALLFGSFMLALDKLISLYAEFISFGKFLFIFLISILFITPFNFILELNIDLYTLLFFFITISIVCYIRFRGGNYQYYTYILIVFLIAEFTVSFIVETNDKKEKSHRLVLVDKVANERDPVAEHLMVDFERKIMNEPEVSNLIQNHPNHVSSKIRKHLQKKYFNGYWAKYDLGVTICNPADTIYIEDSEAKRHCYGHYLEMLDNMGEQIENTNFYFIDNINGRITYFGWLEFYALADSAETTLFVEMNTKLSTGELGYPELLLDGKFAKPDAFAEYSYGKYKYNQLVAQSGGYSYNFNRKNYEYLDDKFAFVRINDFSHLIYNIDSENSIIISKPVLNSMDLLISFAFSFVMFYMLLNTVLIARHLPFNKLHLDFKTRLQFSMITVITVSLLVTGGSMVYFNIQQYENKHIEGVSEKIEAVKKELGYKIGYENLLAENMRSTLNEMLTQLANVFYSDLHIYDRSGYLLASSRQEIFDKDLIGVQMHPEAYKEMIIKNKGKFLMEETIGKMEYLSAYIPLKNADNKILAYINLPYFSRQDYMRKEISTFVLAMVNIYALLILLAIVVAVFVSNKISQPLQLIKDKLRKVELRKKNEQILYTKDDEIGSLVKEYNRMAIELTESAELLAKSERETAWREMAKQIAHEIKNPLTPMKLSIQLLLRSWQDKDPTFDKRLMKISRTLIEQIDRLSAIATGFSNFAKMPKAKNEAIDLVTILQNSSLLFETTQHLTLKNNLSKFEKVEVFADKEQLSRVFINLIKNGIQAIPDGREGVMNIELIVNSKRVITKITDNGSGISEDLKDKLFRPNFTTKTSGMGLGLAIVKSIIETAQGKIWFETRLGKGTSFFVEFPVHEEV